MTRRYSKQLGCEDEEERKKIALALNRGLGQSARPGIEGNVVQSGLRERWNSEGGYRSIGTIGDILKAAYGNELAICDSTSACAYRVSNMDVIVVETAVSAGEYRVYLFGEACDRRSVLSVLRV